MVAACQESRRRWFRLTPGRLLLVLLAVEGFLWLSERFQWFAFNHHKGYAVLIAVASVGVFLLLMLLWFLAALLFRWRFQFSLLSLLALTVAVALPCGWLETAMQQAREQREAVRVVVKFGGWVIYDYQSGPSNYRHSGSYYQSNPPYYFEPGCSCPAKLTRLTSPKARPGRRGCGSCWGTTYLRA